jgi:hypothetical protein
MTTPAFSSSFSNCAFVLDFEWYAARARANPAAAPNKGAPLILNVLIASAIWPTVVSSKVTTSWGSFVWSIVITVPLNHFIVRTVIHSEKNV